MPKTEQAYERIRDERREQIIQAAAHIFARKGLGDTRITDIAKEADISDGLVYRYFPKGKEEVFAAVIERAMHGASRLAQEALQQPGTPLDQLRWFLLQALPDIREKPNYALVVMYALTNESVPAEVREMAVRQSMITVEMMRKLISAGQNMGVMASGDPGQLALLILSSIQGLASQIEPLRTSLPAFNDVELLLRLVKPS